MRQLLLMWGVGPAAAVFVVGCDGRVVITGDTENRPLAKEGYDFIRPGRVAGEIAEAVDRIDVCPLIDVGESTTKRGKISVEVGKKSVAHQARPGTAVVIRRVITTAESGHAP